MGPDNDNLHGVRQPYVHPLTPRLNEELESRGFPPTRRERRKALRRIKRLLAKRLKHAPDEGEP